MTSSDDPIPIAEHLVETHGYDGAIDHVRRSIADAHANKDFYGLSVWREVRRVLRDLESEIRRGGVPES